MTINDDLILLKATSSLGFLCYLANSETNSNNADNYILTTQSQPIYVFDFLNCEGMAMMFKSFNLGINLNSFTTTFRRKLAFDLRYLNLVVVVVIDCIWKTTGINCEAMRHSAISWNAKSVQFLWLNITQVDGNHAVSFFW